MSSRRSALEEVDICIRIRKERKGKVDILNFSMVIKKIFLKHMRMNSVVQCLQAGVLSAAIVGCS